MIESFPPELASAILDQLPYPVLVMDKLGRMSACNAAFEELVGNEGITLLRGPDRKSAVDHPATVFFSDVDVLSWTGPSGTKQQFAVQDIELTRIGHSRARLFINISREVELERASNALSHKLEQHILTDPVTGLLNQRGLILGLEPQVARSRRYNSPISIIMMGLYTDQRPDEGQIVEAARLIKDQVRWADLVGCIESSTFTLILPETTMQSALKLATKLSNRLQQFHAGEGSFKVRCGVAAWKKSDNATTLLKRAQSAMTEPDTADETSSAIAL